MYYKPPENTGIIAVIDLLIMMIWSGLVLLVLSRFSQELKGK